MKPSLPLFIVAIGSLGVVSASTFAACSGEAQQTQTGGGGHGGNAATTSGTGAGGELNLQDGGLEDSGLNADSACAMQNAEATLTKKPVDIIFVIDNSGSMGDEIVSVQNNINVNFAAIIEASGVDYRVIMLAEHGEAIGPESICVGAPLSGTSCMPVPPQPANNPPIFFHYSSPNNSHNSLCKILDTYNGGVADQYGFAPMGWQEWVRPEALKTFVEITDDSAACTTATLPTNVNIDDANTEAGGQAAATAFETALFGLQPAVFGDATTRNYVFYSIVGLGDNVPPEAPYQPADPIVTDVCSTAVNPGTGYQQLSVMTGGLRFPLCSFDSYDAVFQEIAKGVIDGAKVSCEFPVPEAPDGQTIDLETVVVEYTAAGVGDPTVFGQVPSEAECKPESFYIENNAIKLCPATCTIVQADDAAKLNILFGCKGDIN